MSDASVKMAQIQNSAQLRATEKQGRLDLARLKSAQEKMKAEQEADYKLDRLDRMAQHEERLAADANRKEKLLKEMNDSLQSTQSHVDKEILRLKNSVTDARAKTAGQIQHDEKVMRDDHEIRQQEETTKANSQLRELHQKSQEDLYNLKKDSALELADTKGQSEQKLQATRLHYHEQGQLEAKKHEAQFEAQKYKNKHEVIGQHRSHQVALTQQNKRHLSESERVSEHHKMTIAQQEQFYEKKFQNNLQRQHEQLKRIDDSVAKQQAVAIEKSHERVRMSATRSHDPFYSFTDLAPEVKELEKHYEVRVQIPEHAKNDVNLTTNHKEIVITSNRRFQEERKDESGAITKVNKVESSSNRIPVTQVLNPKQMTKSWQDGTLVFTVAKA